MHNGTNCTPYFFYLSMVAILHEDRDRVRIGLRHRLLHLPWHVAQPAAVQRADDLGERHWELVRTLWKEF